VLEARDTSVERPTPERPAAIQRIGGLEVAPRNDGYSVTIRLNEAPSDPEWVKLFEHPPELVLMFPARRPALSGAAIEVLVRNEDQMTASVRYVELAIAEANQVYNDEVLPRRARHRRIREAVRADDEVGLDAMARAASAL
jgi:hypothetical protein